jgi:hypothetical protein
MQSHKILRNKKKIQVHTFMLNTITALIIINWHNTI